MIVWHRKAHKTTLAINELIRWASAIQGMYWYVAPFYGEAKDTIWHDPQMLARYCPPEIWSKRNSSELYIPFPNGSMLFLKGADHPDSLRGPNPKGVMLDEYATMKSEVWSAIIQPIMTANPKAWTWFLGTPKGRNDFYTKYHLASGNPSWFSSLLKASQSGIISKESLDEAQRTQPQALFRQEMECDFIDNASGVFRRVKENVRQEIVPDPIPGHKYQIGVDLAKYQDWTVITVFDLMDFKVVFRDRFNQVDWNVQKSRIEQIYHRYPCERMPIDSTGVGDPIVEDLGKRGLPVIAYKFTEISRRQLLENLAIMMEKDEIKIPNDEQLINELESMIYELGPTGKIKMVVPAGLPDDGIMSLALSVWGADRQTSSFIQQQQINITRYNKQIKE